MSEELDADLRQGAKAAAAAAAVGAAVGVARAIAARAETAAQRRDEEPEREPEAEEDMETEPELEHEQEFEPEPEAAQETPDDEPEQQPQPKRQPERRAGPMKGAAVSEIRRLTTQARELLHELSGVDVEAVSAVDRLDGGWRITLEAVEVRRIPDSTDVLATYAVDLDGDGDLVRYERRRRYSRSQSDGGGT